MSTYSEIRFWSPTLGCDAARLSMVGEQNREYFRVVPVEMVRDRKKLRWRDWRNENLEEIEAAIVRGDEPGEVT